MTVQYYSPFLAEDMELFAKGSAVRLRNCHEKYLTAEDDERAVRQSRNGQSRQSIWTVEMVPRKPDVIRLKSCYGKYLTASETPFLLGMTGERVIQTAPFRQAEYESDWEPIRDDLPVKLMSWNGKFLRANGGMPPWKNSVTHDHEPYTSATRKWILWFVEIVENPETASFADRFSSPASSFGSSVSAGSIPGSPAAKKLSSFGSSTSAGSDPGSPASVSSKLPFTPSSNPASKQTKNSSRIDVTAIEFFHNAKSVRLRSVHDKYLVAEDDEETVTQGRNGSSRNAKWVVEPVSGSGNVIRLKSCHGTYLTASHERFLMGATGRKVVQSRSSGRSGEWEPVKEGSKMKLKSRNGGEYLRANGGIPPWRNSVTHDTPKRTATQDWVVWEVDVVEITESFHGGRRENTS
ncbi:PREDICTED: uncharacterized protein LOC104822934 [Tarenaya hassleriana]|uniref:uncharacterized protein LOC104822934 n=1 Tax=Tarenaya hassleriana TaxID=28532 RepID=UPI00053C2CF0|nr:PREDICTED: uncharacterized protein LOC104822934 [Tarenaya hassleriana]